VGHTHDALWRIKTIRSLSADIKQVDGVDCISVDDSSAEQRIKNINAKRYVPIHSALLEQGFMAFVTQRKTTYTQLFDYKPVGIIEDW
jgi:kynurenine formamidase